MAARLLSLILKARFLMYIIWANFALPNCLAGFTPKQEGFNKRVLKDIVYSWLGVVTLAGLGVMFRLKFHWLSL